MGNSAVLQFDVPVFSERWGHDDPYTLKLAQVYLELSLAPEKAICRWTTGGPVWQSKRHSLEHVLGHDRVEFPPEFKRDLRQIWTSWRTGSYDDVKAVFEMERLFNWLNLLTRSEIERRKRIDEGEEEEDEERNETRPYRRRSRLGAVKLVFTDHPENENSGS